ILYVLPWLDTSKIRSATYRPIYKQLFWIFAANALFLGWLGQKPAEGAYLIMGRISTAYYFIFFLILPLVAKLEKPKPLPVSIFEEVAKKCRAKED
ncbi:MAG: cytochrome C, partial [Rhodospirillaceae bacterium]|nr:cytochrome C [Rhodospirillaceae bacterium]